MLARWAGWIEGSLRLQPAASRARATGLRNGAASVILVRQSEDRDVQGRLRLRLLSYERRRVVHIAVTDHPTSQWTARQLVEATPFDQRPRFLVCDNDPLFRGDFDRAAKNASVEIVRTPPQAPNCSPYVERFIRSVREELLDHVIVWNERHLLHLVREYARFFVGKRPHQGLGQEIRVPDPPDPPTVGRVVALPVLGGLHHDYVRRAA